MSGCPEDSNRGAWLPEVGERVQWFVTALNLRGQVLGTTETDEGFSVDVGWDDGNRETCGLSLLRPVRDGQ
jgi:hypothetical protein